MNLPDLSPFADTAATDSAADNSEADFITHFAEAKQAASLLNALEKEYKALLNRLPLLASSSSSSSSSPLPSALPHMSTPQKTLLVHGSDDSLRPVTLVDKLNNIFHKYQEQPTILDPHLESLVRPLIAIVKSAIETASALATHGSETVSGRTAPPPQPQTAALMHFVDGCCKVLYTLCKVRGSKTIVNFFPNAVADIHLVLGYNSRFESAVLRSSAGASEPWETRYIVLLWLWGLCLIPFNLTIIDTEATRRILSASMSRLHFSDKTSDAASSVISRLLTRPDMRQTALVEFLDFAQVQVKLASRVVRKEPVPVTYMLHTSSLFALPTPTVSNSVFILIGLLSTLAKIFKNAKRDELLAHVGPIVQTIDESALLEVQSNALLRKLAIKLIQRLALAELKPRLAAWRYQRGARSVVVNLNASAKAPPSATTSALDATNNDSNESNNGNDNGNDNDDDDSALDKVTCLESVIELLLNGLRDKDSIVRWSAAKGLGRITGRLPASLADDVTESILEAFSPNESEHAWHGACLAIAELCRRGLVLPTRLPVIVPIVLKCLVYDVKRGAASVGSNVRDAACFVCWSFARAYASSVMQPFMRGIASGLIAASCFDREVNCRRAASAALQELVGRQKGAFVGGIDIVVLADYFAVGNTRNAFLAVAPAVARLDPALYTPGLVNHLLLHKVSHWERSIRELAAQCLELLCSVYPAAFSLPRVPGASLAVPRLLSMVASSDALLQQGVCMALGYILRGLARVASAQAQLEGCRETGTAPEFSSPEALSVLWATVSRSDVAEVLGVVSRLDALFPGYKGMSGEAVLFGQCELLKGVFLSGLVGVLLAEEESAATTVALVDVSLWQRIIDACLSREVLWYPNAVEAFDGLCRHVYNAERARFFEPLSVREHFVRHVFEKYMALCKGAGAAPSSAPKQGGAAPFRTFAGGGGGGSSSSSIATREGIIQAVGCFPKLTLMGARSGNDGRFLCQQAVDLLAAIVRGSGSDGEMSFQIESRQAATVALGVFLTDFLKNAKLWSQLERDPGEMLVCVETGALALLEGCSDYTVDNRGDVGLLVRESSVSHLSQFLRLFHTAFAETAPRLLVEKSAQALEKHSVAGRFAKVLVRLSMEKIEKLRVKCCQTISELLSVPAICASVPAGVRLCELYQLDTLDSYLSPAWIAKAMRILDVDEYCMDALTGVVISVGGLTESLVKSTRAAWVDYVKSIQSPTVAEKLAARFIDIFKAYSKNDRVTFPLLKTLDILLSDNSLMTLWEKSGVAKFPAQLFNCCLDEMSKCVDVGKILAAVNVFCGMVQFPGAVRTQSLVQMTVYLCHRFPKVRKAAADQLFVTLMTYSECVPDESTSEVLSLLSENEWDGDAGAARVHRGRLCELLGVPVPK